MRLRGRRDALVPRRGTVDTHGLRVVALAVLEDALIVVGGHVPVAAHLVVDVLAVLGGVGPDAGAEAELVLGDERGPLVVLYGIAEGVAEDEAADWEVGQ